MPTGYTDCIGKGATFNEFVLGCARAIGACASFRESDEIKEIEYTGSHLDEIEDIKAEICKILAMTDAELEVEATKEHNEDLARRNEGIARVKALKEKYESMLEKVNAWTPPTEDHRKFKTHMVSQIIDSLKFDCSDFYQNMVLQKLDGITWRTNKINTLVSSMAFKSSDYVREIKKIEESNKWIRALLNSLKTEK